MQPNQLDKKSQAWSALFSEPMSDLVEPYTSSVFFDKRLWQADIAGSLAHAEMLAAQKIISEIDHASIQQGLGQISAEIESGAFEWKLDLEDVHLNIEARLTTLVGDDGNAWTWPQPQRPGRHRRASVAARRDRHRGETCSPSCKKRCWPLPRKMLKVILPGFTHLQVAQPVSFGHHMLAYVEMFCRDAERLRTARRVNRLPLGPPRWPAPLPDDRERVAKTLGMVDVEGNPQVCQNTLDAVSDRDFAIEFTAAAALVMMHFRRLAKS